MRKLLTICPTKNRPKKCKKMLESFEDTSWDSDLVFVLDKDEKYKKEYLKLFYVNQLQARCMYRFLPKSNITQQMNHLFSMSRFNDYEYYHITNDDFVYHTNRWDLFLMNKIEDKKGIGIAYGNDTILNGILPTAPLISGDIVRALGWVQMPRLTHLYGDSVWKTIGHKFNMLYYCPEIIIEHQHIQKDKKYADSVSKVTNHRDMYIKDHAAVKTWLKEDYNKDMKKIERIL